jgi:ribosomal protein S18 acetylase RimI-like enzyme
VNLSKYLSDVRSFPGDALRAWRIAGWAGVQEELQKRTLDRLGGYVRRFVIEADLSRLAEMARSRLAAQFGEATAAGRTCLVAWKRRQAVGYAWFSPSIDLRHERYDLQLPSDAIYIWQLEVAPAERRRGVAAALLSSGLMLSRAHGFRRGWIIVHPDDAASLRAIASVAPSRVLGTVARVKVLSWIRSRYKALSAPVPIEGALSR